MSIEDKPQEYSCQGKHDSDIQWHDSFKEKLLEIVWHMPHDIENNCWYKGCQNQTQKSSLYKDIHSELCCIFNFHLYFLNTVFSQIKWALIGELVSDKLDDILKVSWWNNVKMTILSVKWVPLQGKLTLKLLWVKPFVFNGVFFSFEYVFVLCVLRPIDFSLSLF